MFPVNCLILIIIRRYGCYIENLCEDYGLVFQVCLHNAMASVNNIPEWTYDYWITQVRFLDLLHFPCEVLEIAHIPGEALVD